MPNVWVLGDCAAIEDPATGQPYPPTAQHAVRNWRRAAAISPRESGGVVTAFRMVPELEPRIDAGIPAADS